MKEQPKCPACEQPFPLDKEMPNQVVIEQPLEAFFDCPSCGVRVHEVDGNTWELA